MNSLIYNEHLAFILLVIINTIIGIIYLIVNLLRKKQNKPAVWMRFFVIFICPVAGILFLFVSHIVFKIFFRKPVSLADVIFSKERVETHVHADEDWERNIVPIEEAINVTETGELRDFMMSVVRGDIQKSLSSIILALNSEDSETAHYAAAVLQDALNTFREKVDRDYDTLMNQSTSAEVLYDTKGDIREAVGRTESYNRSASSDVNDSMGKDSKGRDAGGEQASKPRKKGKAGKNEPVATKTDGTAINPYEDMGSTTEERVEAGGSLLDYMDQVLSQRILSDIEQKSYLKKMDDVGEMVYGLDPLSLDSYRYEALSLRHLEVEEYDTCRKWADRAMVVYPNTLASYTCRLKLFFNTGQKEEFERAMTELKNSSVVIDSKTLELIRVFQ